MPNIKSGLETKKKKKKNKTANLTIKGVQQLETPLSNSSYNIKYVDTSCVLETKCSNATCNVKCQLEIAGWVND